MSILDTSASAGHGVLDPIAAKIKNPFSTTVSNNGERPQDFPGGFTITEYVNGVPANGLNGSSNTAIKLIGNMMPFQPFEWSGEQRLVKEYYPGNPEASVQVLGPKEGPLVIKGRFKDKRYKDNKYYGVAYKYSEAVEEMRRRGNLVKFGMSGAAGDWFRWGFLERASFKMNKQSWVDYEIEFFIVSTKQPKNNYFAAKEKSSPDSVNQTLLAEAANFQASYSAIPSSMPLSLAGLINNLISGVAKNVNLVTNFVSTVIGTAESIEHSANRAIGLIKNARANISIFRRQIGQLAKGAQFISNHAGSVDKLKDTYKNAAYLREASAGTHHMASYLARMQAQFEAIARTIPKARYKVHAGDTLQNISIKFYQTSDNWTKIYDHNKLQSTALKPGIILEIPRV